MSKGFQLILVLITLGAGFLFYKIQLQGNGPEYQTAPFKTLEDLKARGQVETYSYEEWKKKNNVKSTRFEQWKAGKLKVPASSAVSSSASSTTQPLKEKEVQNTPADANSLQEGKKSP